MTDRKRDPLPEGYQFGDAGVTIVTEEWLDRLIIADALRRMTTTFDRRYDPTFTANVIEGDGTGSR